jgi:hypothetical protein
LVGLELIYIYKDGVGVEFVYHDQKNDVVGEIVLDSIWFEPLSFEFSMVSFSGLQKPHDMVIEGKGFIFVMLVSPFYQVGLSFHYHINNNLVGLL